MTLPPPSPWTKRLVHSFLLLLLLVAVPGAAHAEGMGLGSSSAPAHLPGTEAAMPLRLLDEPLSETPQSQNAPPPRTLGERVLAELGLGFGVPIAMIVGTAVFGAMSCHSGGSRDCLTNVVFAATPIALILGFPVGVWLGGKLTGGQGYYLGALLGGLTGLVAGGAAVYAAQRLSGDSVVPYLVAIPFAAVAPFAGAIAGYELSASLGSTKTTDTDAVHLRPVLGVLPGGAAMGLHGTF